MFKAAERKRVVKATNTFSTQMAQDASTDANITGLVRQELEIQNVAISSDAAGPFDVLFFDTDDFCGTTYTADSFVGYVRVPLSTCPAGYHGNTTCTIPYRDADVTSELHVRVINRTAGLARAKLSVFYAPRQESI